jgi:cytochrome c
MKTLPALLATASLLSTMTAFASPDLARQRLCMSCHAVERKVIGPSFKEIAQRYAGQAGAQARLADKIVNGGSGAWGAVPMPANPKVTPEEARQLAAWVLSIK